MLRQWTALRMRRMLPVAAHRLGGWRFFAASPAWRSPPLAAAGDGGDAVFRRGDAPAALGRPDDGVFAVAPEAPASGTRTPDMMDLTTEAQPPRVSRVPSEHWSSQVKVYSSDFHELPQSATVAPIRTADDLRDALPTVLKKHFDAVRLDRGIEHLSPLQQVAIPILRQGHNACVIGPPGTGKTLTYMLPLLSRLLGNAENVRETLGAAATEEKEALNEIASRHEEGATNICRYCGLNVGEIRVCPETGAIHDQPVVEDVDLEDRATDEKTPLPKSMRPSRQKCEPIIIIVAPTAMLVMQIHSVARRLHCNLKVREFFTAKADPERIARMESAMDDADVLVTALANLRSLVEHRRIRFHRLQSIVFDELDVFFQVDQIEGTEIVIDAVRKTRLHQMKAYNSHKALAARGAPLPSFVTPASAFPVQFVFVGSVLPRLLKLVMQKVFAVVPGQSKFLVATVGNGSNDSVVTPVRHTVFLTAEIEKAVKLRELYEQKIILPTQRTIVFVNSRSSVQWLAGELATLLEGFDINITKGVGSAKSSVDVTSQAVQWFENGTSTLLIATDVLASGIDFKNVHNVIIFEMPRVFDDWIHRVGRIGRAGQMGHAITFFMPEDAAMAKPLVKALRERSQRVPPKLSHYAANSVSDVLLASMHKHKLKPGDPERHTPATGTLIKRYVTPGTLSLGRPRTGRS